MNLFFIVKSAYLHSFVCRRLIDKYINHFEGGVFWSKTIRRIYSEAFDIHAGIGTYGCFTRNFRPHVDIGNYCSIAPGVQRLVGNHPITDVSTHPLFHLKEFGYVNQTRYVEHRLTIGNDVWIGVNAIITGNVDYIGNGAIIGAGAVVTKNVEPYSIVAGVPARMLRMRFSSHEIELLEKSQWYKYTPQQLKDAIPYANNIEKFRDTCKLPWHNVT